MTTKTQFRWFPVLALLSLLAIPRQSAAADGVWTNELGSLWSDPAGWTNATIADGVGSTADFSQMDLTAALVVTLDANQTVGNLAFGDLDTNTAFGVEIGAGGGTLTLSTPATISVGDLGASSFAQISPLLSGTAGLIKNGPGELRLSATPNPFTGGVTVNAGTLYTVGAASISNQPITLNDGVTLSVGASLDGPNTTAGGYSTFVPSGATARLVSRAASGVYRDIGGGAGSTLIISNTATGGTVSARKDWNFGGSLSNIIVTSSVRGFLRMLVNQAAPAYNRDSLANTWLHLEKTTNYVQTGSTGSYVTYGALSGTPDARITGGNAGAFAEYRIGSLNVDSEFQGVMDADLNATTRRGLNLVKVGAGKLTLSGVLPNFLGTNVNTTGAFARGGNIIISNGVLALINSTTLPPGTNFGFGTGDYYSPITIYAPGRLDVSGYTAGTYASAPLQRWQGSGAVVGDMLFGESTAILSPGADLVANTITFSNNVAITNGTINFDISPSLVSGNDRINVAGAATLDGTATLNVGFLGGASTGTYVVLEAAGGITGSVAGWTVNWAGRGAAPSLAIVGNQLQLTVSAGSAASVIWRGTINNNWDGNVTSNWLNGVASDKFYQLDVASFDDDAGVLQTNINLVTTLSPSALTVSNSANAYTFSGSGQIAGGGPLTKDGNGTLTLLQANSYTGGTTNKGGGVLNFGTFPGAFGSGPIVMQGATLEGTNNLTLANAIQFATGTSNAVNANGGGTFLLSGNISGAGQVALFTDQSIKGVDLSGDNSTFSGTLTLADIEPIVLRFRSPTAASALATFELGDVPSATLGAINSTAPSTFQLGALTGGGNVVLTGHASGALGYDVTWEIGGLGTSTTFAGTITDGSQTGGPNNTSLRKVGAGTLTLTGFHTYTGDTTISNGVLSISQPALPVGGDVVIAAAGKLELNFSGTNVVKTLTIAGGLQANGTYGATGSGAATIDNAHFSGTGVLQVGPNASAITATVVSPTQLSLDWLAGQGWRLQNQTNNAATGLSSNWADVPGATPPLTVDIDPLNPTVFYRLVFP